MGVSVFLLIFLAMILAVISKWLSSPEMKGRLGEHAVHQRLVKSLKPPDYVILRDVTLRTARGTTQIDHIVVSRFGLFVIETKNFSGWIFGSEHDRQWTQSFRRARVSFQNPLRQNYAHTQALQELLALDSGKLFSVVVFTGAAEFKKSMPPKVLPLGDLVSHIQARTVPLLGADEVNRLARAIESSRLEAGAATSALHIASLRVTHRSIDGAVKDTRRFLRHGIGALVAIKALVGVVLIVGLLLIANTVIKTVGGLAGSLSPRPSASASAPPAAQPTPALSAPASRNAPQPAAMTPLQLLKQQQATQAQQREDSQKQAWEASLMCSYSTDTMRCACYDPKGGKVTMEFDECRALADRAVR